MTENHLQVHIECNNPKTRSLLEKIIGSMNGFRVASDEENESVDLLIFELGRDAENDFQTIETLLASGQAGEVFLTAESIDPDLLLKAMRAGIKEFIPQPIREEEVRQALAKIMDRRHRHSSRKPVRQGKIIHVIGSKGGIGTTTVAVNLAASFAEKGKHLSVCLVDMNMLFGEIPIFLDIKPAYSWGEILKNMDRLDSTYLMNVLAVHPSGIHVLASPNSLNGLPPRAAETMGRLLTFMRKHFDVILIDNGPRINDTTLRIMTMADAALLLAILSFPCLANTNKLLHTLSLNGFKTNGRTKIIVNRYLKKSEITLEDAKKSLSANIFWTIPNDYRSTISAINQGKPLNQAAPNAPATRSLTELAEHLLPTEKPPEKKRWSLFSGLIPNVRN